MGQAAHQVASLFDAWGREVYAYSTEGMKGINTVRLDGLDKLSKGFYTLIVHTAGLSSRQKLVKTGSK